MYLYTDRYNSTCENNCTVCTSTCTIRSCTYTVQYGVSRGSWKTDTKVFQGEISDNGLVMIEITGKENNDITKKVLF